MMAAKFTQDPDRVKMKLLFIKVHDYIYYTLNRHMYIQSLVGELVDHPQWESNQGPWRHPVPSTCKQR